LNIGIEDHLGCQINRLHIFYDFCNDTASEPNFYKQYTAYLGLGVFEIVQWAMSCDLSVRRLLFDVTER
jgi:hypothetical protein